MFSPDRAEICVQPSPCPVWAVPVDSAFAFSADEPDLPLTLNRTAYRFERGLKFSRFFFPVLSSGSLVVGCVALFGLVWPPPCRGNIGFLALPSLVFLFSTCDLSFVPVLTLRWRFASFTSIRTVVSRIASCSFHCFLFLLSGPAAPYRRRPFFARMCGFFAPSRLLAPSML